MLSNTDPYWMIEALPGCHGYAEVMLRGIQPGHASRVTVWSEGGSDCEVFLMVPELLMLKRVLDTPGGRWLASGLDSDRGYGGVAVAPDPSGHVAFTAVTDNAATEQVLLTAEQVAELSGALEELVAWCVAQDAASLAPLAAGDLPLIWATESAASGYPLAETRLVLSGSRELCALYWGEHVVGFAGERAIALRDLVFRALQHEIDRPELCSSPDNAMSWGTGCVQAVSPTGEVGPMRVSAAKAGGLDLEWSTSEWRGHQLRLTANDAAAFATALDLAVQRQPRS